MPYLQSAIQAAKAAGRLIREKAASRINVETKASPFDLVTEVDKQSEAIIRDILLQHHPEHAILGEESAVSMHAQATENNQGFLWIVDPLDGTTNFIHGVEYYCVSIGLLHQQSLIVGVVYDPIRDELFAAVKNEGAWLNGKPIRVASEATLAESLLGADLPANETRPFAVNGIARLSSLCRNIRTAGSTALELAHLAAGRFSGFWMLDLKPWDVAAGALIVQEAGGHITDTLGHPFSVATPHVAASNGLIHDELLHALRLANGTGYPQ